MVQGPSWLNRPAPTRVGFVNIPRQVWAGGYNYLANLFSALDRYRKGEFTSVVFAGNLDDKGDLAALAAIPGVEIVRSGAFDRGAGLLSAAVMGIDNGAAAEFKAQHIDVVFESARFFGWRLPFPAVAWFPDFQHRKLPQLFPPAARWRREVGFRLQIASGRHIMVSSRSSLSDFRNLYPTARNNVCVVRFATRPPPTLLTVDTAEIVALYRLPKKYFYLPNQFYRHKNHQVVIDALTILAQRSLDVVVCASGSTEDRREPGYFEELMRQVQSRGLESRFRHLGMIPLPHVYALLRGCVGMINPSRSEGWSTTVEEAKSFGVPMILSAIDVHREQAARLASYFEVDDPTALADRVTEVFRQSSAPSTRDFVFGHDDRVAAFAAHFASLIRKARQDWRNAGNRFN